MFDVTISLQRANEENKQETFFGLNGHFLTIEEMLLNTLTLGDDIVKRLGLNREERAELLHRLQFRRATLDTTNATAECTFGVVKFAWVYRNEEVAPGTVVTAVTPLTVELMEGNEHVNIVVPVHGVPHVSGPEAALQHCRTPLGKTDAHYAMEKWVGPFPIVAEGGLFRAFYEGTYLRSFPAERLEPIPDTHLVVTLVTNNICSINATHNPAWFEALMFSGDYPDNKNPFAAIHRWFAGTEVVPFRNADGSPECIEVAAQQHAEICNLLRLLGNVECMPNDAIALGVVFTFGNQGGVCLQVSRVVPPRDNMFALPEVI